MIKGGWGNDHLNGNEGVNLLDGDEGVNKLWNGTRDRFARDPAGASGRSRRAEPPQDPRYVTSLGDSTHGATLVYQNVGGADHTLEITG